MAYIGKSPSTGIRNRFIYTATAGQTTFSGTDDHNRTLSYTDAEFTDVFLNGVKLDKSDYTATSGTSIVLDSGATVGDTLEILGFDTFSVFSGDFSQDVTVGGAATVSGDLTVDTNTLHVDSTNNNVGIGTSSPNSYTGFTVLTLNNATNGAEIDFEKNGTVQGSIFTPASADDFTITAAHASGDLIFQAGGYTERMRIDSSGNVLVGTTDNLPVANNDASGIALRADGNAQFSRSGAATARFNRGTSDGEIVSFGKDGTTVGSIGSFASGNRLYFAGGNSALTVLTNEIYPATNTGAASDNTIQLGSSGARFSDLYLGGNLYLGGTGSANALDDYEEGTFTATLTAATTAPSTPPTATGNYTKIGNLVNCRVVFSGVNTTGGAGYILVTGLPFSASSAGAYGDIMLHTLASFNSETANVATYISGTSMVPYQSLTTSGWASVTLNATSLGYLYFSATYPTSS